MTVARSGRPPRIPRLHVEAKIGDTFGDRTVTGTMDRGWRGRSDERVVWKCICGAVGASYVFNLRSQPSCRHVKVCFCGHHRDDHRPRNGECLDDDCDCLGFVKP